MPAGQGLRARTRDMFSRSHRGKGVIPTTVFLRTFKLGDFVDIKVNSAVHGGMPFKWYHGKTGIVWNITKRAVGVEVNKQVGNRIIKKRLHVRIEHVIPSRCNELFHKRRLENDALKAEATKKGERLAEGALKRQPKGPRPSFTMQNVTMETVAPIPYDVIKEGLLS